MIKNGIEGVEFICLNTDVQSLKFSLSDFKLQIGKELTKGLGAGADPDVGRDAALEDRHEIQEALIGADMVFITAGMGGGTGTGGAAIVAQIARELGALTVGVVTKPFGFEGKRRKIHAEIGIERLRENVDTLIVIPNQRLLQIATPDLSMMDAFKMADAVLVNAVRGISDIINIPGTINVDFADVKTVMSCMGQALMGIGRASGPNRAVEAANQAISSPLLEDIDIEGASGILINITAGRNVSLLEVNEACTIIQEAAHEDANIIFGAVIDESFTDEIQVTVIATGFPNDKQEHVVYNNPQPVFTKERVLTQKFNNYSYGNNYASAPRFANHQHRDIKDKTPTQQLPKTSKDAPVAKQEEKSVTAAPPVFQETILKEPIFSSQTQVQKLSDLQPSNPTSFKAECPSDKINHSFDISIQEESNLASKIETIEFQEEPTIANHSQNLSHEIDKKIDEALELAERMKFSESIDEIEIPTFLRNGLSDLSIN